MANVELAKYVQAARAQGVSDESIKSQLLQAGWKDSDIIEALPQVVSGITLPIPPAPHASMWISFQYILLFISLYISAFALGGILFHMADQIFPDQLAAGYGLISDSSALHWYIACLVVSFPIFSLIFISLKRELSKSIAVRNLPLRKGLIYLTLLVTFIITISDFISNIFDFLQGQSTPRSIAHLMIICLVAGGIFLYLALQIREERRDLI